jgi:hypothetical protein
MLDLFFLFLFLFKDQSKKIRIIKEMKNKLDFF